MNLHVVFADPRRKGLAVLAAATALSLLLAGLALQWRAGITAPRETPRPLLPGFAEHMREATSIRIATRDGGTVEIAFLPMKGWVLPAHDNYPASFDTVRRLLNGLAALDIVEPKTARPDWFGYINLVPPPQGGGTLLTVRDGKGATLASLIFGKSADAGSGGTKVFVRKADENQSWLARLPAPLPFALDEWMDKALVSVERNRIARVEFSPASGPAFTLVRDSPDAPDFHFRALPHGREPSPEAVDAAGAALVAFAFDDVRPRAKLDFSGGAHVVTRTFDGLSVVVDVVREDDAYWARLYAAAAAGSEADEEARTINTKAYGWAYRLPAAEGAAFTATLEQLLQPKK